MGASFAAVARRFKRRCTVPVVVAARAVASRCFGARQARALQSQSEQQKQHQHQHNHHHHHQQQQESSKLKGPRRHVGSGLQLLRGPIDSSTHGCKADLVTYHQLACPLQAGSGLALSRCRLDQEYSAGQVLWSGGESKPTASSGDTFHRG